MALKTINIPGQAYFVTSKVYKNQNIFVYDEFCEIIMNNLEFYGKSKNFKLLGYVIMPNHIHIVIWPMGKYSISDILRDFKKRTAKEISSVLREDGIRNPVVETGRIKNPTFSDPRGLARLDQEIQPSQIKNNKYNRKIKSSRGINKLQYPTFSELLKTFTVNTKKQYYKLWQSRNWITNIYAERFLRQKLNYIHNNPVRAKIVNEVEHYKYSSFRLFYLSEYSIFK